MNLKRIAAAGLLAVSLLGFGATAASASTAAPASGCPVRDPGVRIWQDGYGWHVRVTHNTLHDRVFAGEIVTRGELVDVHAVRLERNDFLRVRAEKHAILFRFNNYGGHDGVDFKTQDAPSIGFGFLSNGHVVPTGRIAIGAAGAHPAHDPFVIKL